MEKTHRSKINIISVGPGNKKYLTLEALNKIECSNLIIGPSRFMSFAPNKYYIVPTNLVEDTINIIAKYRKNEVSVLVSGDAGFYSISRFIVDRFGKDNVEVIPGISIVQAFSAYLRCNWSDMNFFSFHGKDDIDIILKDYIGEKLFILCDNINAIKSFLIKSKMLLSNFNIWVCQNFSLSDELIINLKDVNDLSNLKDDSLKIMVLIPKREDR
ncbi:MAG: precorrin-6y C5,15-methyltransferase (decarboxylating) subunit CbiE [Deferribacterota bacterium]|nr:precorrin-6y C5,15-methyltransferase (decarboxylating) subunit CbiE [Deferribacterota bacterium]